MPFIPHSSAERDEMLAAIGVASLQALFADVPAHARFPAVDLPPPVSQLELGREIRTTAGQNVLPEQGRSFCGGGVYHHFRPAIVDHVIQHPEFYTAYTPYQPEASQGLLQAMFEYQTMICSLTGMEVCNASHYDGATALAEAARMALAIAPRERREIIMPASIHPHYRAVVRTYLTGADAKIRDVCDADDLHGDCKELPGAGTAAVIVQSPNVFGQLEDLSALSDACKAAQALLIVITDPISLGIFKPPGAYGADIVVADGQCLGLPPAFGGPSLGVFATLHEHVRRVPGRLVARTTDRNGCRGYVLTLGTREQHIRREHATSNICTNAALGALAASVYLSVMGREGLKRVAELCYHKCHYAAAGIATLPECLINPQAPAKTYFKEFVVRLPRPAADVLRSTRERDGLVAGIALSKLADHAAVKNDLLIAVTETSARADIDRLLEALANALE